MRGRDSADWVPDHQCCVGMHAPQAWRGELGHAIREAIRRGLLMYPNAGRSHSYTNERNTVSLRSC
jgi:hypothetical protein